MKKKQNANMIIQNLMHSELWAIKTPKKIAGIAACFEQDNASFWRFLNN